MSIALLLVSTTRTCSNRQQRKEERVIRSDVRVNEYSARVCAHRAQERIELGCSPRMSCNVLSRRPVTNRRGLEHQSCSITHHTRALKHWSTVMSVETTTRSTADALACMCCCRDLPSIRTPATRMLIHTHTCADRSLCASQQQSQSQSMSCRRSLL